MSVSILLADSVDTSIYISQKQNREGEAMQLGDIFVIIYFSEIGTAL